MEENVLSEVSEVAAETSSFVDNFFSAAMLDSIVNYGLRFLGVVILFIVGMMIAKFVRKALRKGLKRVKLDITLAKAFSGLAYWLVLLVVVLACLSIFGIETTSVAAVVGAAGLAIGLAFQGTLANLAAGVMLLVFRPFKVGDFVSVAGVSGTIDEIRIFDTLIDTLDRRRIIVPNSQISGAQIENVSFHPIRRVSFTFGVGYEADIDHTRSVLKEVVNSIPTNIDPENSAVILQDLADSSVTWECRIFVNSADFFTAHEQLVEAVKKALDKAHIEIPYPQIVVSKKAE